MQLLDGQLVLSPSDLCGFLACPHLTQLERKALRGEIERPDRRDPELDVLQRRGEEHERRHLEHLKNQGLEVVEIEHAAGSADALREAHEATLAAMRRGVDVVYQATFFDGRWTGRADFLRKVEGAPSDLGPHSYEVEDTKLAKHVRASAVLQLCAYSDLLAAAQGTEPGEIHLVLGGSDTHRESLRLVDYAAYYRSVKARFEEAIAASPLETYPDPVEHCAVCRFADPCSQRRRADDHLCLVAGMRRDQSRKLVTVHIATTTALAESPDDLGVPGIGDATLDRLRRQSRLQVRARHDTRIPHELVVPPEPDRGLCALPEPTPHDLFLDLEGDPFVGDHGLEYLFGVVEIEEGKPTYHAFWAHDRAEEKRAFETVVDLLVERLDEHPDLHVYHYASYEPTALKRLMGVHSTREDEVDRLLRGKVLVDLYRVVCQGVRVGTESYALKELEPLYMEARSDPISDASSSIVAYEEWLRTGDDAILDDLAAYNHTDCHSTRRLRDWLERLRDEAAAATGSPLPRPSPGQETPSDDLAAQLDQVAEVFDALMAGLPDDSAARTDEQQARFLLAHLLGWHRREQKSDWWAYYDRLVRTDEELADDPECIGGLEHERFVGPVARSVIHRYRFDPEQEHKFGVGDAPLDPATKGVNTIVALDATRGVIDLKRGLERADAHPTSLIPAKPLKDAVLRDAVLRVGRLVAEHGLDRQGPYRAVRNVLLRRPPRLAGQPPGGLLGHGDEPGADAARRLAPLLDHTCLPIQGPPGAGKTYTGARMVVDLVEAGKRVGITALSHKAIGKLLDEVSDHATERGVELRALQKCNDEQRCSSGVPHTDDATAVEAAVHAGDVDVVAGTAWLFARGALFEAFDVLFVDEAGQLSLANLVAVGQAAHNLVLLGDPRQLAQPSKGSHPPGAGASGLEHLLGGHATLPPERGLFLEHTWRLHPYICAFVSEVAYEGRLESAEGRDRQALGGDGPLAGSGLRYVPVEHEANRTSSPEEAAVVTRLVEDLRGRPFTDHRGETRPLGLADILVVAPYNAQVACLARTLPTGACIGTVDKFQGQQAAVAIYSMAASSLEQIPRGIDFLFSLNRLNVAVSRSQALAVLVCSPELLRVDCRTPRQMRLANALCRLVELSRSPTL